LFSSGAGVQRVFRVYRDFRFERQRIWHLYFAEDAATA